jgi:hypothetical protein
MGGLRGGSVANNTGSHNCKRLVIILICQQKRPWLNTQLRECGALQICSCVHSSMADLNRTFMTGWHYLRQKLTYCSAMRSLAHHHSELRIVAGLKDRLRLFRRHFGLRWGDASGSPPRQHGNDLTYKSAALTVSNQRFVARSQMCYLYCHVLGSTWSFHKMRT